MSCSRRTCNGLSLLTEKEIIALANSNAYPKENKKHASTKKKPTNNKKTLVLDIDETILSVQWWTADIRIGDVFKSKLYRCSSSPVWTVSEVSIKIFHPDSHLAPIILPISSNREIEIAGGFSSEIVSYRLDTEEGKSVSVTISEMKDIFEPYFGTFTHLHGYNLRRPDKCPVSFFCDGFVIRLRPHLAEFLRFACESYNVVLFTAAARQMYSKVIAYIKESLKPVLGSAPKFEKVFFRDDCDLVAPKTYHKDLTKLGIDFSELIIIDDKHVSFRGFEANAIRVKPFRGHHLRDNELLKLQTILSGLVNAEDVRYPICNLENICMNMYTFSDLSQQFLTDLRLACEMGSTHSLQWNFAN